jgi:antirestriction protein
MKIFITNLAKYNEGVLRGEWVCLPMDEKKLQSKINNILESDEEFFITDYEAPIKIEEYDNIADLNEFAEKLDGIREREDIPGTNCSGFFQSVNIVLSKMYGLNLIWQ